jgi:hypothetical protein
MDADSWGISLFADMAFVMFATTRANATGQQIHYNSASFKITAT